MSGLDRVLRERLGEVEGDAHAGASDFGGYADGVVDFVTGPLRRRPLAWQRSVLTRLPVAQACLLSANGCGKSELMAWMLIHNAAARGGVSVYMTASAKQHESGILRALRRLCEPLGFTPYKYGLHFPSGGALLIVPRGSVASMQGPHDRALLICCDESQDLQAEEVAALQGNCVGAGNALVLAGNAVGEPGNAFQRITQGADPSWHRVVVTAFDVIEDPLATGVAGLVTKEGVDRLRQTWGEEHAFFQSRAWARWPRQSADALYRPEWVRAMFERHQDGAFAQAQQRRPLAVAADIAASEDGDECCFGAARGGRVLELLPFREPDLMRSVDRMVWFLTRYDVTRTVPDMLDALRESVPGLSDSWARCGDPLALGMQSARIVCDEIGVGAGFRDRLRDIGFWCEGFNASRRPDGSEDDAIRFANEKARAYATLRDRMARGQVSCPYDPLLEEEMLAAAAFLNSAGRLQVVSKEEVRRRISRSPDRLECLIMLVGMAEHFDPGALSDRACRVAL